MPVRGPGITRNTRSCLAAVVFMALVLEVLSAIAAEGPHIARSPGALEGTPDNPRRIVLLVDNLARVQGSELETAQALAAAIFRTAGLESTWAADGAAAGAGVHVRVVLGPADRSERMITRLRGPADLLGMAPPRSRRVYLFAERIRHYATWTRRSFEAVLGHVLAHEVGHHLLPGQGHTDTGIMQADIGQAFSTPWFDERQVRSIHALRAEAGEACCTPGPALDMRRRLAPIPAVP